MAKASGQKEFCLLPLQPYKLVTGARLIAEGEIQVSKSPALWRCARSESAFLWVSERSGAAESGS